VEAITGHQVKAFVFIAVEKEPPYAVSLYSLDERSRELGTSQFRADLETLRHCLDADEWPCYGNGIKTLSLPAWSFRE
jgi:exodeoxyribonuclease VIII